jgi:phosphoglycolate phosphatase
VIRLAIFDCDGTLVDCQDSICRALEESFSGAGLPAPSRDQTRQIVGLSLVEAMAALLPDADEALHRTLAEEYKTAFKAMRGRGQVEEPLYDGIPELLDTLEADGWLLGVATGKSDRGLGLCLDCHGLSRRFVTLQTADRHPSKPHPSMIAAALADAGADANMSTMIGDTSYDMAMAKAAGVTAIGVAWGYHQTEELIAAGADFVATHPREVAHFMKAGA